MYILHTKKLKLNNIYARSHGTRYFRQVVNSFKKLCFCFSGASSDVISEKFMAYSLAGEFVKF